MRYFLFIFLLPSLLWAEANILRDHRIHEAFMTVDQDQIIFQAVPVKPPENITERVPPSSMKNAEWIPGYWFWSKSRDNFVWISGTWRVPPPGHEWVPGKWKVFEDGWVWLNGFWSPKAEKNLSYIQLTPPDKVDEEVGNAPGSGYFWMTGHWVYDDSKGDFAWYMGRWQEFDQKWNYVPAHYVWRERGFALIEGYWDWPLSERGVAYAAAEIPQDEVDSIAFLPKVIVDADTICHIYYPFWPDHFMTFQYWYNFHPEFDFGWGDLPVWWQWPTWWTFSGVDLWSLWWWWTHPGFPHPYFITQDLAADIVPPGALIQHFMQEESPLPFIAPSGVMDVQDLIHAVETFTGHSSPVLPSSPEQVFEIQEDAHPMTRPTVVLKPTATSPPDKAPAKPFTGPAKSDFALPVERTPVLNYPDINKIERPTAEVAKPQSVKLRKRNYTEPVVEEEVPDAQARRVPPHRYLPRNNTGTKSSNPDNFKPLDYKPRPRYSPSSQTYTPRRAPEAYKPAPPSKPSYQPRSNIAPYPQYKPPSKEASNFYSQQ